MTSFSAIIFPVGPNTRLVTAPTYNLMENGRFEAVSAYVTLLLSLVVVTATLLTGIFIKNFA